MTEQPVQEPQRAQDISAKVQHDIVLMRRRVADAIAAGMTEQEVLAAMKDAFVRSLTELAQDEPVTFALVVADLIMARGLGA